MNKILVVDDSIFSRFNICNMLNAAGYDLAEAANGCEALEVAASFKPDCILTDLLMPELDGIGLLAALNEHDIRVPVIVLTADIQETKKKQCLTLGAAAFLTKPPQKAELLGLLDRILVQEGGQ